MKTVASFGSQLMSEETLAVRKKYLEAGVGLKDLYQVPDDHIRDRAGVPLLFDPRSDGIDENGKK